MTTTHAANIVNNPAAGSRLAELAPVDRARVAVAVADLGPGIYHSPLCGGSIDSVGRYVAEGRLADQMRDRYSFAALWAATAEYAQSCPEILTRTVADVRAATAERQALATTHEQAAAAAYKARDYTRALTELETGEMVDPDHHDPRFRTWNDLRAIITRAHSGQ